MGEKKRQAKAQARNAQDLTLRNLRQINRRLVALETELDILRPVVQAIENRVHSLEERLHALHTN